MIYYETLLFFFVLLTIVPVIIGFLLKNKLLRFFCWFITVPFLFLTISTIRKHSDDIDKQTGEFLGNYRIDIVKSVYKGVDITQHKNLILQVKKNNSFLFIGDTLPFVGQTGKWKFYDNEDGGYLQCYFNTQKINAFVSYDNKVWKFLSDCLRNSEKDDVIYFNKIE